MKNQKKSSSSSGRITDARFASFETDPRFRLPSKKRTKTTLDKRFAGMLDDEDFTATAKVDRYGRKIKSDTKKKALQRLYQQEEDEEDESKDEDADEDEGEEDGDVEVDDDELVQRELRAADEREKPKDYDPARHGGFSASESDSDSDEDSDEDEDESRVGLASEGDMQRLQDEQADVETGEVTSRIAVVNLDWDHVKSTDLMALFSSFLPADDNGRILKISVYPSEFGKERMQQEELEGPPKALFKNEGKDSDDESDDGSDSEDEKIKKELMQEGDDEDFDSDALRSYQLDRLRYYYAVMVCSSPETAQKIYEATDGTEYQSSSNVIDLRFVPDGVTFDDEPRDECDKVPDSYKPVEFVTNALQSSKVKLTWDMHPEEASRKESINRAFTGSRANIEENDLRAYLASDSEDDKDGSEGVNGEDGEDAADEPKLSKKELARKKMREALGLANESVAKEAKDGPVGDMQITFTSALSESKPKDVDQEETTIEKYKRKEKERKDKKRQAHKAKREAASDETRGNEEEHPTATADDDLGFDDPFFTTEGTSAPSKTSIRKEERLKKRQAREAAEAESAAAKAHLTKVMAQDARDNQAEHLDHFDMNEIMRAEKKKNKKGKKEAGSSGDRGGLQEDFTMDVEDDRFKAVFDSHEFAIDPSNPKFKATAGMKKLLEEGRRKRQVGDGEDEPSRKKVKKGRR
ncbi:pre-rRNA-processing protein ESF1 [Metarhizium acridum CQMa 102]|uniref:Pre-rRNA-processing protein ESF1 n=1 Tax=Metarhizium acridum (strain CQMa 102) TaxID=655827 RepID=E9ED93_METAQ|nr:pre-rRNA-processing protein ESF1 [Metarhizium acridum CQMa 102]EFY86107.1 pre-rRNA-processing protein ESF1 [Metarhizium acridum CQMa 102]